MFVLLALGYHVYDDVVREGVNLKRTFGKITGEDILKMYEVCSRHSINYKKL